MTRASARVVAVGLLSGSTLAFEILLVRLFAIEQFYHFAYMAIGVAMLGFGVSGTLVALLRPRPPEVLERWFARSAVVAAFALLGAPLVADVLQFDATQLAIDTRHWIRLGLLYMVLAFPFAAGALVVLLGISLDPVQVGRTYGASFVGAGMGAAIAVAVLWVLDPVRALIVPALLAGVGAVVATHLTRPRKALMFASYGSVLVALMAAAVPPWGIDMTPYKGLPQVESYPNAERVAEESSPIGWVVGVGAAAFRHAPGLSLAYRGSFPRQVALFVDGQLSGALTSWMDDSTSTAILDWLPAAIPYALGSRDSVLVLGAGGGIDVWTALHYGARHVTAVELHPALATLQRTRSALRDSGRASRVRWVTGDARHAVASARARFDVIAIGAAGGFGGGSAGLHSLNEDYLHTVDAYRAYLAHLRPDGVLAITRWLATPPRTNVRVVLTAARALRRHAPARASEGMIVLRSWGTVTTLLKPDGFTPSDVARVDQWAASRQFDVDWKPGLERPVMRFHHMEAPVLFDAAQAGLTSDSAERAFVDGYAFAVNPVSDRRPFPHHFLNLGRVRNLLSADVGDWLPFAEWGYVALLATLVQAVVVAGGLLIVPTLVRAGPAGSRASVATLVYFGAIGFAYLAAEIAAIQQLGLLLGHPVYAVAAVLVVVLMGSGLGSVWSDTIELRRGAWGITMLVVVLSISSLFLLSVVHALQDMSFLIRGTVALLVLAPMAFLMGIPFPLGLRLIGEGDQRRIAWAWATNGFASVVAGPLAALLALEVGVAALFGAAAIAYAVSALVLVATRGRVALLRPSG